jgi:arylsulfatase A-like enzyme
MYAQGSGQPNIIFIFSDDLMTITDAIGGGSQIIAPNIQRLADRGVTFTRACANATVCGPSRASVFTGVLPSTSGHFGYRMGSNSWENNPVLGQTSTMFAHMKSNGYRVYGLGKIFHRSADNASDFNVLNTNNSGPIIISATSTPDEEEEVTSLPGFPNNLDASHFGSSISLSELENYPGYSWAYKSGAPFNYVSETDRSLMGDELITQQAVAVLNEAHVNPFFLTLGYRSPHTPQYAPDTFYELYNFGSLELATLIHESPWSQPIALEKNRWNSSGGYSDFRAAEALSQDFAVSEYWLRKAVHGYYALVSFLDHQIGIILDELDASPYANNTMIILSSDHGYHLGDKLRIKKTTLWNQASLVPLIIAGPGVLQGVTCNKPVSLIDIYPTLVDAAAIPNPSSHNLDGSSLFPLLQNPEGSWNGSPYAISAVACDELIGDNISATAHHQHYSLISEHMRYIYYSSGEEELYSYIDDPREVNNLIYSPRHQTELNDFRNYLSILLDGKIRFSNIYQNLFYGDFWQKLNGWNRSGSSLATVVTIENSVSPEFPYFATINSPNANYNIVNRNVKLEKDHSYELCFHAKKTTMNGNISVRIVRDVAEDQSVLQSFSVSPTDNWVKYCFEYTEQNNDDPFTRMLQLSGTVAGSFDVAKFSIEDIAKRTALECPQTNALTLNPANTQQASAQEIVLSYTPKYTESPCGINAMPSVTLQKWFRFNAPAEEVNIWAQGNDEFRGGIELFQNCNSPLLACTEGGAPGQKSVLVAKELIPGNEYFVRIYHNALTYVGDTLITGGVLFVPVTSVPPSKCKPVNIAEPLTLHLSGLPSYLNLDSWQLEVTNLTNAGEPVYTSLPPTIPPVFLFNNPAMFFQANKTYRIRARARMYEGPIWGEFGEPCIFNTVNQVPTSQSILTEILHSDEQEILIFPNPLSDGPFTVLIGSEKENIKSVEVFDQLGRLITVETLVQPGEIKVNPKTSIASGLYFVTVITEMGRRTTLPLFVTGLN